MTHLQTESEPSRQRRFLAGQQQALSTQRYSQGCHQEIMGQDLQWYRC